MEREKKEVELNSDIWGKGVCDIWEIWGWREKKRCRIKFWDTGERCVRHMGEMGLERERKRCRVKFLDM